LIAEWLRAPVATTLSGRGCLREDHPLSLGFGWAKDGTELVNRILDTCDLFLAIGVKLSETGTQSYRLRFKSPVIHIDASEGVLGENKQAALTLCMDSDEFLDKLLSSKDQLGPREDHKLLEAIEELRASQLSIHEKEEEGIKLILGGTPYSPNYFFNTLREVLPDDAILVTDSGYHQILAIENYLVLAPRTFITPSDYQSVGYGIPSAIGASLALPSKKVVAVVGDGGFAMSGFEVLTAIREKVNLLIVVFNDSYFGIIKELQKDIFGATCGVELVTPDFEKLAESLHVHYHVASGGIKDILMECMEQKGLVLLEVKVTYPNKNTISRLMRRCKGDLKQFARKLIAE